MLSHLPEIWSVYSHKGVGRTHSTHSPEKILILAFIGRYDIAPWSHHFDLNHLVSAESIGGAQCTVPTSSQVAANSDCVGTTGHNCEISEVSLLIQFTHLGAGGSGNCVV